MKTQTPTSLVPDRQADMRDHEKRSENGPAQEANHQAERPEGIFSTTMLAAWPIRQN